MDFTFSPESDEAAALTARILADHATPERLKAVEAAGDRFDADLWQRLADAGLLGLSVPEAHDGGGLDLVTACRVLVEAGRKVAPVPLASHLAASTFVGEALPEATTSRWLPRAVAGEALLGAAVSEDLEWLPATPATTAEREGEGWRVRGTKNLVDAAPHLDAFLVTATSPQGPVVVLVHADDAGVTVSAQHTPDGAVVGRVDLDSLVPADRLATDSDAVRRLHDLLLLGTCAVQLGVTEGALRLTAGYARTREQFGRPIGTFQAVGQRLADGYIQTLGQSLTLWQAAWRLDQGLDATTELATAALWAADAGHVIAHTTVHVHGGVGIDLDGEAHRYFTAAKRWELTTGGATAHARAIGRALAG